MERKKDRRGRKSGELTVACFEDIPLPEVSGICLRRGPRRVRQVVATGDHTAVVAWATVPDEPGWGLRWQTGSLRGLRGSKLPKKNPQLEAVCADGAGRMLLLQESPARVELVDPRAGRVAASISLKVPDEHPPAPDRRKRRARAAKAPCSWPAATC